AVFVLALGLMVTYLDRGILSLLVEPIKRDLHISDTQMSLLMGFAFVCFYLIVALPIARLVDYKSRRAILGTGTAIWSLTTAVSGLARTFGQLFFCRVGAGVGAACSSPASFSMLADLFPREKLPRAFAVLFFGMFLGEGISLIVGGTLANAFGRLSPISWPVIGTLHGWQLTLIVIGLPGLLIAGLMATLREPARRGRIALGGDPGSPPEQLPIREVLAFIRSNGGIFIPMFASMGIAALMGFGIRSWAPSFYVRTFHWTVGEYGLVQGLLSLCVMPIGALTGSLFAERLAKRGYDDANMRTVFVGQLLSLPGMILFPLMPTPGLSIALCTAYTFFVYWTNAPMNAALQIVTPNQMRGQVTALFLFVYNVIGFGMGPTVVALFTDFVFHSEKLVGYSMAVATLTLGSLTAVIMWFGIGPYGCAIAEIRAREYDNIRSHILVSEARLRLNSAP
ncbi:MAG: MFS transporter, partial [Acidobacteriota bacterium]|nr:MFS transporter [Acidobacteriota bacterium]